LESIFKVLFPIPIFNSHEMINKFQSQQVSSLGGHFSFDKASTLHEKYSEKLLRTNSV